MFTAKAYAAPAAKAPLVPFSVERRDPRPQDVQIAISHCGICHTDLHLVREDWRAGIFPMVPGHEIVGQVTAVGGAVSRFKVGDRVGVGCFVDSCRTCASCREGVEQYCENGFTPTYNARERDGKTVTYGGYSESIVVDQAYVLRVSDRLPAAGVAPLLCAGITTYSPLRHWGVKAGQKVGVVGLGGLGHMALKFAHAFGARVVLFTTSPSKAEDARRLGADDVVIGGDEAALARHASSFDFILDTVSAPHDLNALLVLLKRGGTMTLVGLPEKDPILKPRGLVMQRRQLAGSLIGGIAETQEMLDFCADKGITADVEVIPVSAINQAYARLLKSDVKYRFVIDLATLRG
jgi:uncharacterized zinc-type alcohol dehydrogenase-like protein